MKNIFRIAKKVLLLFCIVFTFATLASCVINLQWWGYTTDTYAHILDRAVLTLIGSFILTIMLEFKTKNEFINFLLPYVIFISAAFLYVFVSGFFVELHPNAYRDIFLNDTIAYVVVYMCLFIYTKLKSKTMKEQ